MMFNKKANERALSEYAEATLQRAYTLAACAEYEMSLVVDGDGLLTRINKYICRTRLRRVIALHAVAEYLHNKSSESFAMSAKGDNT